jgi:hypothetical protein
MPVLKEVGPSDELEARRRKRAAGCVTLDELETCSAQYADCSRPAEDLLDAFANSVTPARLGNYAVSPLRSDFFAFRSSPA